MATCCCQSHAHAPNALITCVGDIKVPILTKADSEGAVELGAFSRATIAAVTSFTSPCNNFDGVALEIHTSNLVGARFGKAQNFGRLKGQTGRLPQIGQNRCNAAGCTIHRSEEHTSELQSRFDLVCRLLLEKK